MKKNWFSPFWAAFFLIAVAHLDAQVLGLVKAGPAVMMIWFLGQTGVLLFSAIPVAAAGPDWLKGAQEAAVEKLPPVVAGR